MLISICVPVYNSELTIKELVNNIKKYLKEYSIEFILVNDGSKDDSEIICENMAKNDPAVRFISLRKNFGEHNAVMCGLNYCTGDFVVIIDDDFQNPPSEIVKLVKEAEKGFDVVYSKYHKKKHHIFRNLGSKFNDIVATWLLNKPKDLYLSSFKLIKKEVVKEIIKYTGPFPYIDGLILRVTSNISSVFVDHNIRKNNTSNYTFTKLISLWLNMFINFSVKPLRIVMFFGLIISLFCAILAVIFIIDKLLHPAETRGWASIRVIVLFIGGIQMIFLGIIGEYIGKQYLDINNTPQWVVKKKVIKEKYDE